MVNRIGLVYLVKLLPNILITVLIYVIKVAQVSFFFQDWPNAY